MTEVDFYLLSGDDQNAFEHFVVRLAEKSMHSGRQMLLLTPSQDDSKHISHQLWHLRPESFLPHGFSPKLTDVQDDNKEEQSSYRLWIGHECTQCPHNDVLLNLSGNLPDKHFSRFTRFIELVQESDTALERARKHYQFFMARGYPIRTHDLRKKSNPPQG